jgi:hypothetical protein
MTPRQSQGALLYSDSRINGCDGVVRIESRLVLVATSLALAPTVYDLAVFARAGKL